MIMRNIIYSLFIALSAGIASGQQVCPNCGRLHTPAVVQQYVPQQYVPQQTQQQTYDVGFAQANRQRASRGLGPLTYDPVLQRIARQRVNRAVALGRWGHQGGNFSPANKEGVGMASNMQASACYLYTSPAGTPAGVAMAQARNGSWYTVLLIRHNGYLAPKPGGVGGGRMQVRRGWLRRR